MTIFSSFREIGTSKLAEIVKYNPRKNNVLEIPIFQQSCFDSPPMKVM